jgi:hypothetical protein
MEKIVLETGEKPSIYIETIGRDLRLSGRESTTLEVQAPESGKLTVKEKEKRVVISCKEGCLIFLPKEARVEVGKVGGDTRVTGLSSEILMKVVGGDVRIRRSGRVTIETVGGDLSAHRMDGDLTVDRVGGDVVVQQIAGDIRLRVIGGDAIISDAHGLIDGSVGGDAIVNMHLPPDSRSSLHSGGDLFCRIPSDCSATVTVRSGGEKRVPQEAVIERTDGEATLQFGEGDASLALSSGGDLMLRTGDGEQIAPDVIVDDILKEVDLKLVEMEARFNAIGAGIYDFDADRIGERVRRAVARSQRKAEKTRFQDARKATRFEKGLNQVDIRLGNFDMPAEQATEEERLAILKMVEGGKITVDEAEMLLRALEGDA